ncbi:dTMP kinase [Luteipulveratus flavus]|uniref:Thymidylate kinase n=1 Tax=Luteipulveratus flavus TaxID=3031728 RepID=A0ABT6C762_9MICO|nr:dTMP kinase [Luteipulveratus sp. YIM 133296]MDF8264764.1 dTMP kinase [Luteipulveratus sp. YIM 133296]
MPPASTSPSGASGVFIAFEGGDGAGKSTQIERLAAWLREGGHEVVVTREPGGTPVGQQIRELVLHGDHLAPRAEALLFAADRAQHVTTVVRPALERGAVVLQDRYLDSSVAYQGAGRDLDAQEVQRLSLWATEDLRPTLTVLLDVTPEVGRARRGDVHDRLESEGDDFHERVRRHFLELAEAEAHRYLVVDAALPAAEVAQIVKGCVGDLVGESA